MKAFFEAQPIPEEDEMSTYEDERAYHQRLVEDELKALANRDLFVRRGRNNRVFAKFIRREIFRESHDNQPHID